MQFCVKWFCVKWFCVKRFCVKRFCVKRFCVEVVVVLPQNPVGRAEFGTRNAPVRVQLE
jgi:hypothetical protein